MARFKLRQAPPGCELEEPVIDCIEVLKVYDQCIAETALPRQIDLPEECPNPLPDNAVINCRLVFDLEETTGEPQTRCEVINVSEPDEDGFSNITIRQRLVTEITVENVFGDVICGPITVGPEFCFTTAVLYAPEGTFGQCRILNGTCSCEIIADPDNPELNVLLCNRALCQEVAIKALVKLCVPAYGFCVPAPCIPPPLPELPCPPDNIYPPQQPVENNNDNNNENNNDNDG
ncbi:MAG TPA: hypothetical protein VJ036_03700 [bacterium]|jgi:hypothetical protein|nr:hypothetical protein [bacterium]